MRREVDVITGEITEHEDAVPGTLTPEEIAAQQIRAADAAAKAAVKADGFVPTFIAMTPAQVNNYIETNVTNLATAKNVIGKLALMVLLLARREFR